MITSTETQDAIGLAKRILNNLEEESKASKDSSPIPITINVQVRIGEQEEKLRAVVARLLTQLVNTKKITPDEAGLITVNFVIPQQETPDAKAWGSILARAQAMLDANCGYRSMRSGRAKGHYYWESDRYPHAVELRRGTRILKPPEGNGKTLEQMLVERAQHIDSACFFSGAYSDKDTPGVETGCRTMHDPPSFEDGKMACQSRFDCFPLALPPPLVDALFVGENHELTPIDNLDSLHADDLVIIVEWTREPQRDKPMEAISINTVVYGRSIPPTVFKVSDPLSQVVVGTVINASSQDVQIKESLLSDSGVNNDKLGSKNFGAVLNHSYFLALKGRTYLLQSAEAVGKPLFATIVDSTSKGQNIPLKIGPWHDKERGPLLDYPKTPYTSPASDTLTQVFRISHR